MNVRVVGSDIKDGDKKIGVINGRDIMSYPALKKMGSKHDDGTVFNSSGSKVGHGNDGIVNLFLR